MPCTDYKGVTSDLKAIYQASTEEAAQRALQAFATKWDHKYPTITKSWQDNWANLSTIFAYPPQIRKAIYITNAIESLNSVIHHVTNKRKIFPSDDSARKNHLPGCHECFKEMDYAHSELARSHELVYDSI